MRGGVRLLKCLCQTEEEKAVAWHSDARNLERQRIPREFTTKSRVVIISNDWQTLNKNVAALQDRGHVLHFEPAALEVHKEAGRWFDDEEIYRWFGENLHRVREPSLRHYVRSRELKAAGMDWTAVLAAEDQNHAGRNPLALLVGHDHRLAVLIDGGDRRVGGARIDPIDALDAFAHGQAPEHNSGSRFPRAWRSSVRRLALILELYPNHPRLVSKQAPTRFAPARPVGWIGAPLPRAIPGPRRNGPRGTVRALRQGVRPPGAPVPPRTCPPGCRKSTKVSDLCG